MCLYAEQFGGDVVVSVIGPGGSLAEVRVTDEVADQAAGNLCLAVAAAQEHGLDLVEVINAFPPGVREELAGAGPKLVNPREAAAGALKLVMAAALARAYRRSALVRLVGS